VAPRASYTRLDTDERRSRLLELGTRLFTEHGFDEISMAQIAREGGVSKALLYHYFPSKRDFFVATLADNAEDLVRRVAPAEGASPAEALLGSLRAYVGWIEEHRDSYTKLLRSAASIPEVDEIVRQVREGTATRILDGLAEASGRTPLPLTHVAVAGWLWFMDGAILDWVEHRDMTVDELARLGLQTLLGAVGPSY
jgi:AcrR family transcriptional regulator